MNIADSIRKYQAEHGISRAEMARRVDVPCSTLQDWEVNDAQPRADKFIKLISVIGYPLDSTTAPQALTHTSSEAMSGNGDAVAEKA